MVLFVSKRPEVMLISSDRELNLGEVRINTNFEQILADEQWIDDATGLVPHCLSILKTCRFLTESLTALTIADMRTKSGLAQIIEVTFLLHSVFRGLILSCIRLHARFHGVLTTRFAVCTRP